MKTMKTLKKLVPLAGFAGALFAAATVIAADDPMPAQSADEVAPAAQVQSDAAAVETPAQPAQEPTNSAATGPAEQATPQPSSGAEEPAAGAAPTNQAPVAAQTSPAAQAAPAAATTATATDTNANSSAEFSADKGLRMNFKDAQLSAVLDYMSKAAGFTIKPKPGLSINGKVTVWNDSPLSKEEAVDLLKHVLNDNGYTVIQDGKILTIISTFEAKKSEIPVKKFRTVDEIPRNTDVATYVIPVHTLNPIALVRNLQPLTTSDTDLQANESANSLLMTDTQINIRRIAEIVTALDSVSSSINSIKVYKLNYADAKTLASLIKELFPSADARGGGGGGAGARFGGRGGRGGGGGGGGAAGFPNFAALLGGGGNTDPTGQTPTSRIAAVSDDNSNSLVVSAPEDLIPTVDELVDKLDQPIEDVTVVKLFRLTNADPGEMANMLANLFPDDSQSGGSRQGFQFGNNRGGRGGRGGAGGGLAAFFGGGAATSSQSDYMKKMGRVVAVPDLRTQTLMVSASKELMPQIEEMITQLDAIDANLMKVHVFTLKNADPADVQTILQDLFSVTASTSRNSQQSNPLLNRQATVLQNQMQSGVGSGSSTSFGSSSGGSRGGF
jgi:type II secretory pathway component GspD/PulD (secretin)